MKRKILVLAAILLLVASCGGSSKADYDSAAQSICDCMSKKTSEAEADTLGLNIDMTDLDFSLCAIDIATKVDVFDQQMGKSIQEKCPDLKPIYDNYVKSSK